MTTTQSATQATSDFFGQAYGQGNALFGQAYGSAMDMIGFGQQGAQQTAQSAQAQANQAGQQASGQLNSFQSKAASTGQQMQTQATNAGQNAQQQAGSYFSSFSNFFVSKEQQVAEQYGTNIIQMYGIMEKYSAGRLKKDDAKAQCQEKMNLNDGLGEVNPQLVDQYLNSNNIDANKRVWMRDIWDELNSSCMGSLKHTFSCGRC
mmetsp:Transcript_50175/g.92688  ORF Transcript_50175/g.92688 Transcript_50175/m.92688 type:complete len:205 (-) Transcript_50175:54-668(-)